MLQRIVHFLFGHKWKEHSAFEGKGTKSYLMGYCRDNFAEVHGFTDVDFMCECGAHKTVRLIGGRDLTLPDHELEELRKMLG